MRHVPLLNKPLTASARQQFEDHIKHGFVILHNFLHFEMQLNLLQEGKNWWRLERSVGSIISDEQSFIFTFNSAGASPTVKREWSRVGVKFCPNSLLSYSVKSAFASYLMTDGWAWIVTINANVLWSLLVNFKAALGWVFHLESQFILMTQCRKKRDHIKSPHDFSEKVLDFCVKQKQMHIWTHPVLSYCKN